jgi:Holliday junction resolvase
MAKGRGKAFELELRRSMEAVGLYVHRISDSVGFNGYRVVGSPTPGDFFAFRGGDELACALIEAKATSSGRLELARIQPHQMDSLVEFDGLSGRSHGWVAINYYDKENIRSLNRCFMVPIGEVVRVSQDDGLPKSMSMSMCESMHGAVECVRIKGSMYDMSAWADML